MSVRTILSQKSRPYKIEIYGLQDDYIGTLQSYNDSFIGQVVEPFLEIKDDGSQSFTCSIPKFYIDSETNLKVENPRWSDINKGVLTVNTRILKVFTTIDGEQKVYPFIVDKITDRRDSHFSVYKDIEASGLAFAELGKQGYKLELNSHTLESDYKKDNIIIASMNYWLDYVFPNEKDENGKIIKWLTPWCYEIHMDWSSYSTLDADGHPRASNKMYEDSYVSSWTTKDQNGNETDQLRALTFDEGKEKARYIDCINSNKYNITQTIAETFGVFCVYEYKCDLHGKFLHTYYDDNGNIWQGKKVVFYNKAIKTNNPLYIEYQDNLSTIKKVVDSTDIYTKLFITSIQSSTMENGYVSIADTVINPLLDDFILNFDYLYAVGSISDYQKSFIKSYEAQLHNYNLKLKNYAPIINNLVVEVNDLQAKIKSIENEIISARENLVHYQILRDNEITNTSIVKNAYNSYSIVFTTDGDCLSAKLRLEGIVASTIEGFLDYKYNDKIFSAFDSNKPRLIQTNHRLTLSEDDQNYYLLLDEYGYPSCIYTSLGHDEIGDKKNNLIYLSLVYSPSNAYISICDQLVQAIDTKTAAKLSLEQTLAIKEEELFLQEEEYDKVLKDKQKLNQKLEIILGPALREGYWTPDSYEDPGEGIQISFPATFSTEIPSEGVGLIFDSQYFDGEETGYYYDDPLNIDYISTTGRKYYRYIPIKDLYLNWPKNKIEELTIHLSNPSFIYEIPQGLTISSGNYFIIYDTSRYYFTLNSAQAAGTILEIRNDDGVLQLYRNNILYTTMSATPTENASNLSNIFEGISNYLGERRIYNNAGFIFAFIKEGNNIEPVLLLNDKTISYVKYQTLGYSFGGAVTYINSQIITPSENGYILYYPRIVIANSNVNYDSDLLKIISYLNSPNDDTASELTKYEEYSVLVRNGKPYFTLKITNKLELPAILNNQYNYYLDYQLSHANESLYLDAKQVALENSQPRYSYELTVTNVPDKTDFIELGQLVYISDYSLDVHAATGYVSSIKYSLAKPQDDEITIQNYKTKFEDLFSTITASSEAMKNNAVAYNIAANSFTSKGQLSTSVLQQAINNNNIQIDYSDTNVSIDPTEGIILTNTTPYLNGVYGQVLLRGGGIFMSSSIDNNGERIWSTGLTPTGINASLITAGQLDTSLIRVFAGSNMAFQWNAEGIFAYRQNDDGSIKYSNYVKFSDKGLHYISNDNVDKPDVELGWNGLALRAQNGAVTLTSERGLEVFNNSNTNSLLRMVSLGRIENNDGSVDYGLKLYRYGEKPDGSYGEITTLSALNDGTLWLQDTLIVGTDNGVVGLTGVDSDLQNKDENDELLSPIRIWAGSVAKKEAPFWVRQNGQMKATDAIISGNITAEEGSIGGWTITKNSIESEGIKMQSGNNASISVGDQFIINNDGAFTAKKANITGTINATDGTIGGVTIHSLVGNPGDIIISITSANGNIYKNDEEFSSKLTVTASRGNFPFSDDDYNDYTIQWQLSTNKGESYINIAGANSREYYFNNEYNTDVQIRCIFTSVT